MSKIVAFRQRIIDTIKAQYQELDVDWFDGQFDEHDIADWTVKTPSARVAVMNAPGEHVATGELNACLRCVVVIIDENRNIALDGDARAWEYVEGIAVLANLSKFGDPNAAPATKIQFRRISQPVLRREGVTLGTVEWMSDLTIGHNRVTEREYFYRPDGSRIMDLPRLNRTRAEVHLGYPLDIEAGRSLPPVYAGQEETEFDTNEE